MPIKEAVQLPKENNYCRCNETEFLTASNSIYRAICHCKTCQNFYEQAFNDECAYWLRDCGPLDFEKVEFRRYQSALSPLQRGKCKSCGKIAYSIAKMGPFGYLIMVPAARLETTFLPPAIAHVYYDRRIEDVGDGVRKFSGHIKSQVLLQWLIVKAVMRRLRS